METQQGLPCGRTEYPVWLQAVTGLKRGHGAGGPGAQEPLRPAGALRPRQFCWRGRTLELAHRQDRSTIDGIAAHGGGVGGVDAYSEFEPVHLGKDDVEAPRPQEHRVRERGVLGDLCLAGESDRESSPEVGAKRPHEQLRGAVAPVVLTLSETTKHCTPSCTAATAAAASANGFWPYANVHAQTIAPAPRISLTSAVENCGSGLEPSAALTYRVCTPARAASATSSCPVCGG
jgi:hypothetical protein